MNVYYIISGISILCLFVNLLQLKENDLFTKSSIKRFSFLAYFIIIEIAIDTIFKSVEGNSNVMSIILYMLKATEFSMTPILPFLLLKLFNSNNLTKRIRILQMVIIIVNVALQIASLFGKFMFYIDNNNVYHRTRFTIIYAVSIIMSIGLMVFAISVFSSKIQNTNMLTMYGFIMMISVGFGLKILYMDMNYDWLCVSITFFIMVIYYSNLTLKLDPLTQLLNRQVYSSVIEKIDYTTLVIIIDANNFKIVNDTYGHECGDKTLKTLAKCVYKAYSEYGWCFRIGGDEFCVILKRNVFRKLIDRTPKSDVYVMSENLMERLEKIIQTHASKDNDNYLKYGVSQGYGIYYLPSEYPSIENNMPIDKVIQLADQRMYLKKAEYKKNFLNGQDSDEEKQVYEENQKRAKVVYEQINPELIEGSGPK